jgi:hypothetical protein
MIQNFPYTVSAPESPAGSFNIVVRVEVPDGTKPAEVMHFLRSFQLKTDLANGWIRQNAPNHGLEVRGGPRPVMDDPANPRNLNAKLIAYEQEYRLCQRV